MRRRGSRLRWAGLVAAAVLALAAQPILADPAAAASPALPWFGDTTQHHPTVFLLFWGPQWTTDNTTHVPG